MEWVAMILEKNLDSQVRLADGHAETQRINESCL